MRSEIREIRRVSGRDYFLSVFTGLGLLFAWTMSSFLKPGVPMLGMGGLEGFIEKNAGLLSITATLAVLAIFHSKVDALAKRRWFGVCVSVFAALGTMILDVGFLVESPVVAIVGSSMVPAASMVVLALWFQFYGKAPDQSLVKFATLSALALGCTLYLIFTFLPSGVFLFVDASLPIASVVVCRMSMKAAFEEGALSSYRRFTPSKRLIATLAFFLVFSIPIFFLRSQPSADVSGAFDSGVRVRLVGMLAAFLAVCALEVFADKRRVTIVPIAVMLLLSIPLALYAIPDLPLSELTAVVALAGYYVFLAFMYYEAGSSLYRECFSPTLVFAIASLSNIAGLFLGSGVGMALNGVGRGIVAMVSMGVMYVLFAVFFVFLPNSTYHLLTAQIPAEVESTGNAFITTVEKGCQHIARQYGLTPREEEIFARIARGKTLQSIGKEMFLSVNTIKSHVKHIYQKCEVHSQEELMGLLEDTYR